MGRLYEWPAYFARLDDLYLAGQLEFNRAWQRYARGHAWRRRGRHLQFTMQALGIILRLMTRVPDGALRGVYRRQFWRLLRTRRNPAVLRVYAIKCAIHFRMHEFVRLLVARDRPLLNTY